MQVKINSFHRKNWTLVLIPISILFLIFSPIKIRQDIETYGKIMPRRQWLLETGTNGQITHKTIDYSTGLWDNYCINQTDRGDLLQFSFHPALPIQGKISAGDTVGHIFSSNTDERLVELLGQLDVATATLKANLIGEKPAVIREYESRLALAHEKSREVEKNYDRLAQLYEKKFISTEEFDAAQTQLALSRLEIAFATAQLEVARTGEKTEAVQLIYSQIGACGREIEMLKKRIANYTIRAPFAGAVSTVFSSDTLLIISDTLAYVVVFPVAFRDRHKVRAGQNVTFQGINSAGIFHGEISSIKNEVEFLNREHILRAVAKLVPQTPLRLATGTVVKCRIHSEKIKISDYLLQIFNIQ